MNSIIVNLWEILKTQNSRGVKGLSPFISSAGLPPVPVWDLSYYDLSPSAKGGGDI